MCREARQLLGQARRDRTAVTEFIVGFLFAVAVVAFVTYRISKGFFGE